MHIHCQAWTRTSTAISIPLLSHPIAPSLSVNLGQALSWTRLSLYLFLPSLSLSFSLMRESTSDKAMIERTATADKNDCDKMGTCELRVASCELRVSERVSEIDRQSDRQQTKTETCARALASQPTVVLVYEKRMRVRRLIERVLSPSRPPPHSLTLSLSLSLCVCMRERMDEPFPRKR
jgi:hypothetical protein